MGNNITWAIFRQELDGVLKLDSWLVANILKKLHWEEMFDHPYLLRLHVFTKCLTAKNETVQMSKKKKTSFFFCIESKIDL